MLLSPKQLEAIRESGKRRITVLDGAVRSGKTIASLVAFILAVQAAPDTGLIVCAGRTLAAIERNIIAPLQDRALFGPVADTVKHTTGSSRAVILGRTVHLVGANDARAEEKIRGMTAYLAYVDEATLVPEAFFRQLLARLSVPGARLLATTNPDGPRHWLKVGFLDRASELSLARFRFTLADNPGLGADYVQNLKAEYTGLWYQRFIEGLWVMADGVIFDAWNPEAHVEKTVPEILEWISVGIDYGTVNDFVALAIGLGIDRRLHVASEWRWASRKRHQQRQLTDVEYSRHVRDWMAAQQLGDPYVVIDPSAASFIEQAHRDGLNPVRANNAVADGIRTVSGLIATDRLRVHESCEGLIDEIASYAWDPKKAKLGIDAPVKVDDHGCFVTGTPVVTGAGLRPIETVAPGDRVLTRKGMKPVIASGMTSASATVYQVETSDGRMLTGTGNHPVWVVGHGWKRLDTLRYADKLHVWQNESIPLSSKGSSSAGTSMPSSGPSAPTTFQGSPTGNAASSVFTKKSGWPSTIAPSPKATTSITATVTRSTTTQVISNASPLQRTSCTTATIAPVNAHPNGSPTSNASDLWPARGTNPKLDGPGTPGTVPAPGQTVNRMNADATSAGHTTTRSRSTVVNGSAPTPASRRGGAPLALTTSPAHVSTAVPPSAPTSTAEAASADVHVLRVTAMPEKQAVWNLTVADCPEYFASGILVHNCDALRYGLHTTRGTWNGRLLST
ncbi:PBSX family phage terminase large subunit [Glycomyces sp. A-F 0318]|nr:PBSX family phage terminase large subunit [Glycomyces amatae]MCD0446475.1 PBSX family phage terminase large subunit [Glycomyces amatae]